jgi:uncharacterized zinc-type alcohol dehydrogenase-like protein
MIATKGYAAQSATTPLAPYDFERRNPGPLDVEIDIMYCGVCHTDIHFLKNEWGFSRYPMVPGHEIVGKIVSVGNKVKKLKVGDTAGVGCLVDSCRECESCKEGLEQYCLSGPTFTYSGLEKDGVSITQGGYSTKIVVDERFVVKVPSSLPPAEASPLLCAGITTYSPLRHWKVGKGHKIGIVGLGGLGHMAIKFAKALGAEVTVLSTSPGKKADALKLGAKNFVVTTDEEQVKSVAGSFHFIMDTLSANHDYNLYMGMLKVNGTLICLGLPVEPIHMPAFNVVFARKCVAGSLIGGLPETQEMLDFCAEHNIVSDIEIIPIQKIHEAFDRMMKSDVKYRFVIDIASLK